MRFSKPRALCLARGPLLHTGRPWFETLAAKPLTEFTRPGSFNIHWRILQTDWRIRLMCAAAANIYRVDDKGVREMREGTRGVAAEKRDPRKATYNMQDL